MPVDLTGLDFIALLPETIVLGTALLVMLADLVLRDKRPLAYLSLSGVLAAGVASFVTWGTFPRKFQTMFISDAYALFISLVICLTTALSILVAADYLDRHRMQRGEYYALLLFASLGMMMMGAADDLVIVFLALETLSLSLYILTGFNRAQPASGEAALKYFLLGAFASGFFLYGVALTYGATGSTNLETIGTFAAKYAEGVIDPMILASLALLLIGFGFKVALVPFQFWTPDVYQGAPTSVTAFMSVGAKAAGFAALARTISFAYGFLQVNWALGLAILAILTMTWGNVAALIQRDVKRMLAYSSIAHAGYLMVGVASGSINGVRGILFYLLAYALMNVGAFAVVAALEEGGAAGVNVAAFRGLGARRPFLAASMAIFMLSLTGIPPLSGFWGKLYIFRAAVEGGLPWLAAIGVLNSAISAFYYIGIIIAMYMYEPEGREAPALSGAALTLAVAVAALGTLLIGLWPSPFTALALAGV
jgi:NADH-quinone oxidoreductase subunit N